MSGDRHEVGRRRFLQATGAGIAGVAYLSTGVGTSASSQAEEAPDEGEYEEILAEMSGEGTEEDPYVITDVVELQAMSGDVTALYELGNDVDASATADWNDGSGFDPVFRVMTDEEGAESDDEDASAGDGSDGEAESDGFAGQLLGNDHEIAGLTIDRSDEEGAGLLLVNQGAVVDLTITDATVAGDTAGIVAASNTGGIGEVAVDGSVTGGTNVGGVTGINRGAVANTEADVDVAGEERVGGLVGGNTSEVSGATVTGTVEGSADVGGVIGQSSGVVQSVDADTAVTGTNRVGGFVGDLSGRVSGSTAAGDVTGEESVGGFAGEGWGELLGVSASGSVDGEENVGGLAGANYGEVRVCSVHGDVTGSSRVGGVLGWGSAGTVTTDVYTVGSVTGDSSVGALAGLLGWEFLNDGETVELRRAYWNVDATDNGPVGSIELGDGEVSVMEETMTGLESDQFVGEDVGAHMTEFDFEQQWRAFPDEMPAPRAQTSSVFEILDVSTTDIVVGQDETFNIELDVENTGEWEGTQTIALIIDGESFETVDLQLDAGESTEVALADLSASDIPVGTYTFSVETINDTVEGTIEVQNASSDGGDGNGTPGDDDGNGTGNGTTPGDDTGSTPGADDDGPGFGVGGAFAGIGTGAYLLARRLGREQPEE